MVEEKKIDERVGKYPSTEKFRIVDTIAVPHPYCITPKHLEFSEGMYLDIPGAERRSKEKHPDNKSRWAVCDICRKANRQDGKEILSFEEHGQALMVEVNDDRQLKDIPELKDYLLSIKEMAEKDGFKGFAFVPKKK